MSHCKEFNAQVEIAKLRKDVDLIFAGIDELVGDPAAVHVNMLYGRIAKPTWRQIVHLYPEAKELLDALVNLYGIAVDECIVGDNTTLEAAAAAIAKATGNGQG